MKIRCFLTLLALSAFGPQLATAQGSLTPPAGPPVAGMKTLDQVEARIPLVAGQPGVAVSAAGTITISQPGSYYLTRNVTITTNVNGLEINANATVDLNGFGIIGTAAEITTGDAIVIGVSVNAAVRNGFIRGGTIASGDAYTKAGFEFGVIAEQFPGLFAPTVATIQDLAVTGVRNTGIYVRRVSRVERCTVQGVEGTGIDAAGWTTPATPYLHPRLQSVVSDCAAADCGFRGIVAWKVSGCFGHASGNASNFGSAPCGILAYSVESSTGIASGTNSSPATLYSYGIHGYTVSYCTGKGPQVAIEAKNMAIACSSSGLGGIISSPQKHLGTP